MKHQTAGRKPRGEPGSRHHREGEQGVRGDVRGGLDVLAPRPADEVQDETADGAADPAGRLVDERVGAVEHAFLALAVHELLRVGNVAEDGADGHPDLRDDEPREKGADREAHDHAGGARRRKEAGVVQADRRDREHRPAEGPEDQGLALLQVGGEGACEEVADGGAHRRGEQDVGHPVRGHLPEEGVHVERECHARPHRAGHHDEAERDPAERGVLQRLAGIDEQLPDRMGL